MGTKQKQMHNANKF